MHKIKEIIEGIVRNFPREYLDKISFIPKWDTVVGSILSLHSKVKEIENDVLFVDVDHSAVAQEFLFRKKEFIKRIEKINSLKLKDIKVRVSTIPQEKKTPIRPKPVLKNEEIPSEEQFFEILKKFGKRGGKEEIS